MPTRPVDEDATSVDTLRAPGTDRRNRKRFPGGDDPDTTVAHLIFLTGCTMDLKRRDLVQPEVLPALDAAVAWGIRAIAELSDIPENSVRVMLETAMQIDTGSHDGDLAAGVALGLAAKRGELDTDTNTDNEDPEGSP